MPKQQIPKYDIVSVEDTEHYTVTHHGGYATLVSALEDNISRYSSSTGSRAETNAAC
jgi:hypothetical protein